MQLHGQKLQPWLVRGTGLHGPDRLAERLPASLCPHISPVRKQGRQPARQSETDRLAPAASSPAPVQRGTPSLPRLSHQEMLFSPGETEAQSNVVQVTCLLNHVWFCPRAACPLHSAPEYGPYVTHDPCHLLGAPCPGSQAHALTPHPHTHSFPGQYSAQVHRLFSSGFWLCRSTALELLGQGQA